ncbi:MAG: hypothetical protein ABI824_13965 [Acidobacteriota bacterium]
MSSESVSTPEGPVQAGRSPAKHRLLAFCFALFMFEVGLFLLIFPWRDNWTFNYFQDVHPLLTDAWDDPYFKGGISGLGLVNIVFAIKEFLHALRRNPS